MGNATSWLAQAFCPEEQVVWFAAKIGDAATLRLALERMTPENRRYLEWQDAVYGYTPLAIAASEGRGECVRALLAVGANAQARDSKGQTPLHLAVKKMHGDVVRLLLEHPTVDVFARTTVRQQTALDMARQQYTRTHEMRNDVIYCIDVLEQKLGVYSGWLYLRTDNLFSLASGLSGLNSWRHRYCTVLRTADPGIVEIDLFAMRPGEKRPPCPTTEMVYRATDPLRYNDDATWFNKKEFRFALTGYTKAGINRVSAPEIFEFACDTQRDLDAWKTFFANLRVSVAMGGQAAMPSMASQYQMPPPPMQTYEPEASVATSERSPSTPVPSAPEWEVEAIPPVVLADDGVEIVQRMDSGNSSRFATRSIPATHTQTHTEQAETDDASTECVICFDGPKTAVLVPCGHNATCMACAQQLLRTTKHCPVCRGLVREVVKIYRV